MRKGKGVLTYHQLQLEYERTKGMLVRQIELVLKLRSELHSMTVAHNLLLVERLVLSKDKKSAL